MPTCLVFIGRQEECWGESKPDDPLAQPPVLWQSWQRNPRNKDYDATFENARNAASGGVGGRHVQLCNLEVGGWDRPTTTCYFDPLIWCNYQPLVREERGGSPDPAALECHQAEVGRSCVSWQRARNVNNLLLIGITLISSIILPAGNGPAMTVSSD